jgi:DNA-binding response OmpR family regulator/anti-sigma regulatory factor (Ser/Thr protein kinase)
MSDNPKILIVDDTPENLDILMGLLQDKYQLFAAPAGVIALQIAKKQIPDLILLDIMMPGMDGYEVCRQLKSDENTKDIPIIFITAKTETDDEVKGFKVGGVDYITKPFSPPTVLARVKAHLALKREKELLIKIIQLREDVERITHHDLKSPLNTVINFPKIIAKDNLTEKQITQLDKISAAGLKLLKMINLSLDIYKMEQGTYELQSEPVDILSLLDDIRQDIRQSIRCKEATIDITINGIPATDESSFIVPGEELLLYSMFSNLLKNALEASPKYEKVLITMTDADEYIISIHNQGAVPEDMRETFFEKYATSGKKSGTGLGTYSAKLIADTLGGTISMESSEKSGTQIMLSFPKNKKV